MPSDSIPQSEYAARRKKLSTSLKKAVALIYAGDAGDHLHDSYGPDADFEYLTGVTNEPGAILLLAPGHPVASRREALFLRPTDPEMARWDGYRPMIGSELRQELGFETVYRTYHLPRMLNSVAMRSKRLACLHPFSLHTQPVSRDLQTFRKVAERIPGMSIEDHTATLPRMRSSKSKREVALVQKAVDITTLAYKELLQTLRPGMNEFDVQETLEHAYKRNGSRGTGYGSIAAGGINATVAHYRANDSVLQDGELICIDSAAKYNGYCADVTRTFPINGKFTARQREVYDIVLKAQVAAVKATKPGVTLADLDDVARAIIEKAGYGDAYFHSIGHHLGLEVHDSSPDEGLREGAVVTIEPGIYLPDERMGIRIEDDILVTKTGHKNLSSAIPKKATEIEKAMAGRRRRSA